VNAGTPIELGPPQGTYRPGVCNIGPAEIARRRMFGHSGVIASIALLVALVALAADRARDRISLRGLLAGIVVGVLAVLLPL
jgi:hypothetical protein